MQTSAIRVSMFFALLAASVHAQQVLTTFAGADWVFPGNDKPAIDAPLNNTTAITFDPHGTPVFADADNCIVAAIQADGTLSVIAGNGFCSPASGDGGPALSAAIQPYNIVYDPQGNLYISDLTSIRKVSPQGIITAFAGAYDGHGGFSGDGGPAAAALFNGIVALAADAAGNIYVADSYNGRVRRIDAAGVVTTYAGTTGSTPGGDGGPATSAVFQFLAGIAVDNAGNLYISDSTALHKVSGGVVSAIGPPRGGNICVDSAGAVYAGYYGAVGKLSPGASDWITIAGNGPPGFSGDNGPAINAQVGSSSGVAADRQGNVWIADTNFGRIREVTPDGIIRTVAGNGNYRYAGEGLPALQSPLHDLFGLAVDPAGTVCFSEGFDDTGVSRVRKVANGVVTTVAGAGTQGYSGDGGPAAQSQLNWPEGIAIDKAGAVYISDYYNHAIRRVDPSGTISTYAPVDGPTGLAFDPAGRLYSTDIEKSEVIQVDPQGHHLIVAGNGTRGFSGDGGPATSAMLSEIYALAFDPAGNLYIADTFNGRVRKVTPQGVITTFAGGGADPSGQTSGVATQVALAAPTGLAFDAAGNLYIAQTASGYGYVDRVTPAGILSRFAGGGPRDQLGDGKVATSATLLAPLNIAFDAAGNFYIADSGVNRIRVVPATLPSIRTNASSLSFSASSGGAPVTQPLTVLGSLSGLDFTVTVQTAGGGGWLTVDTDSGSTPRILNLTADPCNTPPGTYLATVTVTPAAATPASIPIPVTFTVGPAQPPQLSVDTSNLTFTFPAGAAAQTSQIKVGNSGGGSLAFTVSVTPATAAWLTLSPSSGLVTPGAPLAITVQANPALLAAGTYSGSVSIQAGAAGSVVVPVTMTLSDLPRALLLTQSGMSFLGVANGGVVPPQTFGIVNTGSGTLNWTATTSTLTGGNWLKLAPSPATGSTTAGSVAPRVSVSVDVTGLPAGNYYGLVSVAAPDAANSPRLLVAALSVLPAGSNPGAVVQPSEIVFTPPSDTAPGSQTISVYNIGATPQGFQTGTSTQPDAQALLYALPLQGTLDPAQPTIITLQPTGAYNGILTLDAGGSVQTVKITTAIQTEPVAAGGNFRRRDACIPTKLMPALTSLGPAFTVSAGWPIALSAQVFDDCGNPHVSGSVTLTFSNGDSQVAMSSLNDGTWQGTWPTRGDTNSGVTITVTAVNPNACSEGQCLTGTRQIAGGLGSLQDPPDFQPAGIVGAASPVSFQPLAPGSIFSIYGDRLAETVQAASATPLPSQLGNATVVIGDKVAPLFYGSQQQINAVVPFELNTGTTYDLVVQRGPTYSHVAPISVAAAQPGVFSPNGAPLAYDYTGPAPFLISPQTPAHSGDAVVLFCGGLGAPARPVPDGASSPSVALQNAVTANIGGVNAPVAYAGLIAGFVGLYQINLTVPPGVTPGDAVPLTLTVAGQTSPPASLAVR